MSKYLFEMTAFKSYGVKRKQKSQYVWLNTKGYQGIVNTQLCSKRYLLMLEHLTDTTSEYS